MVETRGAEFHKKTKHNMDDGKSYPSTSQPEASLTN